MSPWKKGKRHESWASNPNIAVYIFFVLFAAWLTFQIWSRFPGGPPPPTGLDPMVMAALGVAISAKSVEKKQQDQALETRVAQQEGKTQALEDVAKEAHPDVVKAHEPPLEEGGDHGPA